MIARGRAGLVVGLVAAVIAGAAPAARAQSTAPAAPAVGPTLAAAGAGVRAHVAAVSREEALASATAPRRTFGRGEVLMIVGGAALLTGLIIGDDAGTLIAVGGAVVGLYGLYLYLDQGS